MRWAAAIVSRNGVVVAEMVIGIPLPLEGSQLGQLVLAIDSLDGLVSMGIVDIDGTLTVKARVGVPRGTEILGHQVSSVADRIRIRVVSLDTDLAAA